MLVGKPENMYHKTTKLHLTRKTEFNYQPAFRSFVTLKKKDVNWLHQICYVEEHKDMQCH